MIPKRPRLSSECEQATGRKRRKSFKELLASRRNEDQLSDTSKDMLQDAIFKLVNHQQDFNTFVSEACSENRNSASEGEVREAYSETRRDHKDLKEAEFSVEGCIAALQRQSSEGEVSLPVLAANTCVNKLCEMLQSRLPENSNDMILSAAERRILDTLVSLMKKLLSTQSFHRNLFVEKLNKQCPHLPLELLWQLHVSSVMPLDVFLTANVGRVNVTCRFAKDMADLQSYSTDELQLVQKILADLLSFLIVQGFPEKQHQSDKDKEDAISKGLQKASTVLLDSVVLKSFERNLQQKTEEEKNCVDVFQVIRLHSDQVPLRVLQRFVSHELSQILTHDAMVKAIEMFSKQSDTGLQIPRGLSTLFTECILILGANDSVIQILQRIVERHDVNWQSVLSFIATFLSNFRKAGNVMNEWIRSLLQEAFEDLNKEKLTIVFLLVRQASLAGTDVFPSYSQWFQSYFTNSNSSLANNKKTFTFLVEFLTEIMPYESEDWLKVHIVNPPYVIPKCKELYLDYIALAKTRIADLKSRCNPDSLSDIGLSNDNSGDAEQQKKKELMEQAQQDVDKAVTAFERNGKIPSTVMEASIFRKPYFLGRFLVALLKPRLLPDVPDMTMKFIDALRRSDKIPSSMFQNYQKACQREINALLEGVFDEDPAEADLEPLDQLKHSLDQLPGNVIKCKSDGQSWQKAHTALISVISERIQSVIGVSKSSKNVGSVFELDVECAGVSTSNLQLVDVILNGFGKTVMTAASHGVTDSTWCSQFMHMLSSHKMIHPALYARLWSLTCQQGPTLEDCQVTCLAVFLVTLGRLEASFLPVQVKGINIDTDSIEMDHRTLFYPLVCKYLHVDTRQWMNFTLRFFSAVLQHAFLTYGDIVLSVAEITNQNQVYIPVDLMSKFCYLVPRLNPDVRWNTEPHSQSSGTSNFPPACVLYQSKDFQALQQQSKKVSLKDWASLELQVQPHQDYLNEVERHDYHHWVIHSHYLTLPVDDGGCDGSYRHACSVLMDAILDHDTLVQRNNTHRNHSIRSCDSSKSCDQRSDNDCGSCRSDIICCLQKLILYLSMEKHSTDDNSRQPWLVTEILKILHGGNAGRSLTHQLTHTGQVICLMRLVQCLPGYLLYTDSPVDPISADSCQEVAHLIDNNLREVLVDECFPCVLPYSVTLHFVTGFLSPVNFRPVDDISCLTFLLQQCQSLKLSIVFHWMRLKPVILKISRDHYSAHFQDLDKIYQWCESLVTQSRDTAKIPLSSVLACPLTLAVAVCQALTERKVPPTSACEIIAVINRQNSQIGREVCFHLMECLTAAVANQTYFPVQESYQTSLLSQLIPHSPDSICRVFIEMDAANGHNRLVLPGYIGKLYPAVFFRLMKVLTRKVHQELLMCLQFCTTVIQMYNSCVKLHAESSSEEDSLPVNADRFFQNEVMSLQFMNEASTFAQWCVSQASLSAIHQISTTTVEACSSELRNAISRRMKIA